VQLINLESINEASYVLSSVIRQNPLVKLPMLDKSVGADIYLKCENKQITGSFKIRGSYYSLKKYMSTSKDRKEVITYSSGNHGIGLAYSGKRLNHKIHVCVTENTDKEKINTLEELGAIIHFVPNTTPREDYTQQLIEKQGFHLIKPFDEVDVITANATVASEIDAEESFDMVLAPIGGGGLISGLGNYFAAVNRPIKLIGLQPIGSPSTKISLDNGYITKLERTESIAHSLVVPQPGDITFPMMQRFVSDVWLLSDEEIQEAQTLFLNKYNLFIEVSSAIAIAALIKFKSKIKNNKVCVIVTGSNEGFQALYNRKSLLK
jgi:threonine dehydratase